MNKIETLRKAFMKALGNGFKFGEFDKDDWDEGTELERTLILRALLSEELYYTLIFNREFAKALWGDKKYMAFYSGYDEWADATEPEPTWADSDEVQRDRMPLWEYHLMMMARSEDRLKYLSDNMS